MDSLTLVRTPVRAIFSFAPELTKQLLSCCNAFWGIIYQFTMPEPLGERMIRKDFLENDIRFHQLMGML